MRSAVTILVFCVAALLALGLVMLYSSGMANEKVGAQYLVMQATWCIIGLAACALAAWLDYRCLKRMAIPLLVMAAILLMLVMVLPHRISPEINGARRWIVLGPVRFQPSEFAKIALILTLAWYGERYQRHMSTLRRGILIPGLFIGLILALIFVEPDRGATLFLAATSGGLLLIAGAQWKHFIPPMLTGIAAFGFSLWHDPMRMKRILSWLNVEETRQEVGHQAYHAMLALGAGGWTGMGLGNSRQKLGFIPFHHTDFILPVIGEELGLVATLFVVMCFIAIIVCGTWIALKSSDVFGLLLGSGITLMIGMQAMINIGVVTSTLPNKGLPLPFISYGGSNLLMMLASVGLLLSIARRANLAESILSSEDADDRRENPFRGPDRLAVAQVGGVS